MHTIKLNIQDSIFDKVINFLQNLPKNEVEIIENGISKDDWSHLQDSIDEGISSGISARSHNKIIDEIKAKYV